MVPDQESVLRLLRDRIEAECGLVYPDPQLPVLDIKIKRLLPSLGANSPTDILQLLERKTKDVIPSLASALTIGETYFMRNQAQFESLRRHVLPELEKLLRPDSPLVIWSAGCATGEEPYSLAMWMRQYAPRFWPKRLHIIATDINPSFLDRARLGRYGKWSLRHLGEHWRQQCFTREGKQVVIDSSLQEVVHFQHHNLVSGTLPKGIHKGQAALIFCRNVFIYFSMEAICRALDLFDQAIMPGGMLFLGHAESTAVSNRWMSDYSKGTFYFRSMKGQRQQKDRPARKPATTPPKSRPSVSQAPGSHALSIGTPDKTAHRATEKPALKPAANTSSADLLDMARHMTDQGRLDEALHQLTELTKLDSTLIEGHFLTALVSEQLADWDGARSALKKAIFLDKRLVLGHYLLAVLDERQGKMKSALKRYRTIERLLSNLGKKAPLPLGDGLTAGRLTELVEMRATELSEIIKSPYQNGSF